MTDLFATFDPPTLQASRNATSSLESADGHAPCASLDGQTIGLFGPAPAHVSRFRALDSAKAMPTNDTSGPLFSASSPSAALQSSLENRLRARMDVNGSPEFALTWKQWDMPAGPQICALRASARRTSGKGCIGWPTPATPNGGRSMPQDKMMDKKRADGTKIQFGLEAAVKLVGWPTPMAGTPAQNGNNAAGNSDFSRKVQALIGTAKPSLSSAPHPR
jgi:hypothetical protein